MNGEEATNREPTGHRESQQSFPIDTQKTNDAAAKNIDQQPLSEQKSRTLSDVQHEIQALSQPITINSSDEPEQTTNKQYLLADEHHEALPSFEQQLKHYFLRDRRNLGKMIGLGFKTVLGVGASRRGITSGFADRNERELMAFFNGENTRELANKYTFVEEIKKLGYDQALEQVLVVFAHESESRSPTF